MNVIVLTQHTEPRDSNPTTTVEGVFATPEKAIEEAKALYKQLKDAWLNEDILDDEDEIDECAFPDNAFLNIDTEGSQLSATLYCSTYEDYINLTLTVKKSLHIFLY